MEEFIIKNIKQILISDRDDNFTTVQLSNFDNSIKISMIEGKIRSIRNNSKPCCPNCKSHQVSKNGIDEKGKQKYLCINNDCARRAFRV